MKPKEPSKTDESNRGETSKPGVLYVGKGLVILVVVSISAISFMLGFYVGQYTNPASSDMDMLKNQSKGYPVTVTEVPKNSTSTSTSNSNSDSAKSSDKNAGKETVKQVKNEQTSEKPPKKNEPLRIIYTVQTGAFKKLPEAEVFKAKLDKKGLTTYITAGETKKHEKLYRVMTGKFKNRNEAEALSKKIRKKEGIHAFVTFIKDEVVIR